MWERIIESYVIQSGAITDQYDIKEKLGQGTFGYVFLANNRFYKPPPPENMVVMQNSNNNAAIQDSSLTVNLDEANKNKPQSDKILLDTQMTFPIMTSFIKYVQDCSTGLKKFNGRFSSDRYEASCHQNSQKVEDKFICFIISFESLLQESTSGLDFLLNEIKVHWALEQCASVLRLLRLYEDQDIVCIVLEYQSQGSLMNTILKSVKLEESDVRIIMEQMLLALDFFQQKKVVHRDQNNEGSIF